MARSLALWLALFAARGGAGPAAPDWPLLPEGTGPLVWLHPGPGTRAQGLVQLAQQMRRARRALRFVLTLPPGQELPAGFPAGTVLLPAPPESLPVMRAFLDRLRPDVAVLTGPDLPPVLIHEAHARGVPLILADAQMTLAGWKARRWRSGLTAALLSRFTAVLAQDGDSARRLRLLAGRRLKVEVTGPLEETTEPLPCNETERESLAALLRTRPVWFASACAPEDEQAVLAAHARASQHAHRMLLILAPADPARGPALAARLAAEGWEVALRSAEQEPEEQVQVLIADTEGEIGLWYRLAPVTFMGGTLHPGTCGRSPFEPAALGSAILYGPHEVPQEAANARLAAARAARRVGDEAELADALVDLIAADRAAMLAHNAWQVSSVGAGATEQVMRAILAALDARAGAAA
ncbi:MAG: 3-deoxy-D-manno-octulosonic acid transferase [Defluviimonas sp.]|nr:3-deoxy-D-manno-octulosonic acid transferase [Defluviimonas sp.]